MVLDFATCRPQDFGSGDPGHAHVLNFGDFASPERRLVVERPRWTPPGAVRIRREAARRERHGRRPRAFILPPL